MLACANACVCTRRTATLTAPLCRCSHHQEGGGGTWEIHQAKSASISEQQQRTAEKIEVEEGIMLVNSTVRALACSSMLRGKR